MSRFCSFRFSRFATKSQIHNTLLFSLALSQNKRELAIVSIWSRRLHSSYYMSMDLWCWTQSVVIYWQWCHSSEKLYSNHLLLPELAWRSDETQILPICFGKNKVLTKNWPNLSWFLCKMSKRKAVIAKIFSSQNIALTTINWTYLTSFHVIITLQESNFEFVKVSEEEHEGATIHLLATAGMRLLKNAIVNSILDSCRQVKAFNLQNSNSWLQTWFFLWS